MPQLFPSLSRPYLGALFFAPFFVGILAVFDWGDAGFWTRACALVALTLVAMPRLEEANFAGRRDLRDPSYWYLGIINGVWIAVYMYVMSGDAQELQAGDLIAFAVGGLFFGGSTMAMFDEARSEKANAWFKTAIPVSRATWIDLGYPLVFVAIWFSDGFRDAKLPADQFHISPLLILLPFLLARYRWPKGSLEYWLQPVTMILAAVLAIAPAYLT